MLREPHSVRVAVPRNRLGQVVRSLHEVSGVPTDRMLGELVYLPAVLGFGRFEGGATLTELEADLSTDLEVDGVFMRGVPLGRVGHYFGWLPRPGVKVEVESARHLCSVVLSWEQPLPFGGEPLPSWDEVRVMQMLAVLFSNGRMVGGVNLTNAVSDLRLTTEREPDSGELHF